MEEVTLRPIALNRWWRKRFGQIAIHVRLGSWREFGDWPIPGRIFDWGGWFPQQWRDLKEVAKCTVWYRFNRLYIPTLPVTWTEWDEQLLHAAMAVFCDYMLATGPGSQWTVADIDAVLSEPDDGHSHEWLRHHRPTAVEMETIYHWWTVQRDIDRREASEALMVWHEAYERAGGTTWLQPTPEQPRLSEMVFAESDEENRLSEIGRALEERNEKNDEDMLIRLMKIRRYLWT